jgi:hypothetical protein
MAIGITWRAGWDGDLSKRGGANKQQRNQQESVSNLFHLYLLSADVHKEIVMSTGA